ncbi:MAG: hypothetical protein WCF67_00615, partial [Chitinophagaceae bacterium]
MNKNELFVLIITLNIFFLISCHSKQRSPERNKCTGNSIIKNIPEGDKDSAHIAIKDKIFKLANLPDLENGFDELQIRIWFAYSSTIENLLIFSKVNGKWEGSYNRLEFYYDSTSRQLTAINRISKAFSPKSGWKLFTDSLAKLGLYNLPDRTAIPGYELERDGHWIAVEFADCKNYKVYRYQSPWGYQDKFPQAKQIVSISKLIENEFG